ncbi:MAG: LacI family DNA-binding transcriptional regulator [Chloroflexota bacterium]
MTSIRDVANKAGVAPITVSRVINNAGYVSAETRHRVEAAIAELQYIPNKLAQSLRFKKTSTLALVVSDITNPFWTTVTRGVEDAASKYNYSVMLCNTDENRAKQNNYVRLLLERQTDGFLLVPAYSSPETIEAIQSQGVPLVLLDRRVPDVQVDVVRGDSVGGAYQLIDYLISLGHRRIAMLTGPEHLSSSTERVRGYKQACSTFGVEIDPSLIIFGEFRQDSGFDMTQQILEMSARPTAIFAGNNFIAIGVLKALHEAGIHVPDSISVVCFDDLPLMLVIDPFLTVAVQPAYDMGYQATELLLAKINGEQLSDNRDIILPTELIIRQSCRAISPNSTHA